MVGGRESPGAEVGTHPQGESVGGECGSLSLGKFHAWESPLMWKGAWQIPLRQLGVEICTDFKTIT
jgi:hypothetical protein